MKVPNIGNTVELVHQAITMVLVFLLGTLKPEIAYIYLGFLIDTAIGVWVAIKTCKFSKEYFVKKTLEKLVIYTFLIIIGHIGDVVGGLVLNLKENQIRGLVIFGILAKELPSLYAKLRTLGFKAEADILENNMPKEKAPSEEGSESKKDGQ